MCGLVFYFVSRTTQNSYLIWIQIGFPIGKIVCKLGWFSINTNGFAQISLEPTSSAQPSFSFPACAARLPLLPSPLHTRPSFSSTACCQCQAGPSWPSFSSRHGDRKSWREFFPNRIKSNSKSNQALSAPNQLGIDSFMRTWSFPSKTPIYIGAPCLWFHENLTETLARCPTHHRVVAKLPVPNQRCVDHLQALLLPFDRFSTSSGHWSSSHLRWSSGQAGHHRTPCSGDCRHLRTVLGKPDLVSSR
jgi:hypothetical protein